MDGGQLRMARNLKRITQYQLELMTGIFQSRISLIERGFRIPTDEEERKIMEALGLWVEVNGADERCNVVGARDLVSALNGGKNADGSFS